VGKRVVPELETLPVKLPDDVGMSHDLAADDEERGGHVKSPERGADTRRPLRVRPIIESQSDSLADRDLSAGESATVPGEERPFRSKRTRRAGKGCCASLRRARREPLRTEQDQERSEQEREDEPAGSRPARSPLQGLAFGRRRRCLLRLAGRNGNSRGGGVRLAATSPARSRRRRRSRLPQLARRCGQALAGPPTLTSSRIDRTLRWGRDRGAHSCRATRGPRSWPAGVA